MNKKKTLNLSNEDYKKIEQIDEQLTKDPDNLNLLMHKAFVYSDGYDDDNAIAIYEKIIKEHPDYIDAYFWLSYYLWQIGNYPKAIKIAKDGLKLDQNRADLHLMIAWSNQDKHGNKEEFLYHIKKAIDLEPTWLTTRISLIYYLLQIKKYNEAKQEIDEAMKYLRDDFPDPKDDMGHRYEWYVTGRCSKSLIDYLNEYLDEVNAQMTRK